jgi:hypothetical protein
MSLFLEWLVVWSLLSAIAGGLIADKVKHVPAWAGALLGALRFPAVSGYEPRPRHSAVGCRLHHRRSC